jgi:hypothetical protein
MIQLKMMLQVLGLMKLKLKGKSKRTLGLQGLCTGNMSKLAAVILLASGKRPPNT